MMKEIAKKKPEKNSGLDAFQKMTYSYDCVDSQSSILNLKFFWNILLSNINVFPLPQCIILWKLELYLWIKLETNFSSKAMMKYLKSSLFLKGNKTQKKT